MTRYRTRNGSDGMLDSTSWSAPAERSGDGALDGTLAWANPKRGRACDSTYGLPINRQNVFRRSEAHCLDDRRAAGKKLRAATSCNSSSPRCTWPVPRWS
jgi:hypothetical protein